MAGKSKDEIQKMIAELQGLASTATTTTLLKKKSYEQMKSDIIDQLKNKPSTCYKEFDKTGHVEIFIKYGATRIKLFDNKDVITLKPDPDQNSVDQQVINQKIELLISLIENDGLKASMTTHQKAVEKTAAAASKTRKENAKIKKDIQELEDKAAKLNGSTEASKVLDQANELRKTLKGKKPKK